MMSVPKRFPAAGLLLYVSIAAVSTATAQGIIIGPDYRPATVTLQDHRVDASIEEHLAVVSVEHVFHNSGSVAAEGTFLFPLPPGAQVTRFAMDVDGRELGGELLSAEEARRIYEDIVRRSLDPALLEMVGHRSFRAGVFPIPPGETRTIRLRYDAELHESGTTAFVYPLMGSVETGRSAHPGPWRMEPPGGPMADDSNDSAAARTSIRLHMTSASPVVNVYSPSHDVVIDRPSDREAVVTYQASGATDGDFVVYFGRDDREVGSTLLAYRPYSDRPGYFMLMLSPRVELRSDAIQAKEVVFVLDTSGSMAGAKMEQSREALRYCLNRLSERDRFGIVSFSSDVDRFRDELTSPAFLADALYFVDQLEARGGTNIHDALLRAAEMIEGAEHGMIIFLTDGLPSVGIEDEARIRTDVAEALSEGVRIFSFGVGYDVNTLLLDGLSRDTGVQADYISPNENIEERVSSFYDRVSHPLLTDLTFDLDGVDAYALAPAQPTDLYKGGQLILTGRYRRPGEGELHLSGHRNGLRLDFRYSLSFPAEERERSFVGRLWATRRVGQLLEEIRMEGGNEELRKEVVALAKEFGLVTPYTSYLVREEELTAGAQRSAFRRHDTGVAGAFESNAASGAAAVAASKVIRDMESAAAPSAFTGGLRYVSGRTLTYDVAAGWTDTEFTDDDEPLLIKMGSEAYFALLRAYPEALPFAQLGTRITFKLGDRFVRIGDDGLDGATSAELAALLG